MATQKQRERAEAIERLREWVKPGDTIYTILRHRSSSGMSRVIDLKKIEGENVRSLGYNVALALDMRWDDRYEGVKIGGAGMDMGFALVYDLGSVLWPDGFDCIGEGCPANDHFNREDVSHHRDGGYALKQRWL